MMKLILQHPNENFPLGSMDNIVTTKLGKKRTAGSCFSNILSVDLNGMKTPSSEVEAFLFAALSAFLADKAFPRASQPDSWTRQIDIEFPTSGNFNVCINAFTNALSFLSGDLWNIQTRTSPTTIFDWDTLFCDFYPDAICLFSGGTDSLVGAINLLESGKRIFLVSHYENNYTKKIQNELAQSLIRNYGQEMTRHIGFSIRAISPKEPSSRSRSILFIALALLVASVHGNNIPIMIPENGFIGINAPLCSSRLGSYSTRTTHPFFLDAIRKILVQLEIPHSIENPLLNQSKGQTFLKCSNQILLKQLLECSVSCSKSGAMRWLKFTPGKNCGCCYPCIIRRAGLNSAGWDNGGYSADAIADSEILRGKDIGRDLRCVLLAVNRFTNDEYNLCQQVLRPGLISGHHDVAIAKATIQSGFMEIAELIRSKGCREVKDYAGIK